MEYKSYRGTNILFRYSACFFIVLLILVIPALSALNVEAEVAIFHSDAYTEQGVEVNDAGIDTQIQYDYLWTDFKGVVPPESVVNSIVLHFSWSLVTRSVADEATGDTSTDTQAENSLDGELDEISNPEEQAGGMVTEVVETEPESHDAVELQEESEGIDEQESSPETIAPASLEAVEVGHTDEADIEGFEQVSKNKLFIFASTQIEENLDADSGTTIPDVLSEEMISDEALPEVMIAESVSTTSGFVSEDMIVESLDEKFFEVRYTTDGTTWIDLGRVGYDESHEMVFDLSQISRDALPNLQIAVRYTVPARDYTKIIFDSLHLEVGYAAPVILELPVPEEPVNDQEPNFKISSIKSDVQSENIRAVVLERGGMLEFWYSITEQTSDEVTWHRLIGGGAVDGEAPIGIKERTIFWLDRNQQTLFGYSVDEQSLFGVPFQNPEEKVFLLPFQNENSEAWEAVFDPTLNLLEFHKVRNKSL